MNLGIGLKPCEVKLVSGFGNATYRFATNTSNHSGEQSTDEANARGGSQRRVSPTPSTVSKCYSMRLNETLALAVYWAVYFVMSWA